MQNRKAQFCRIARAARFLLPPVIPRRFVHALDGCELVPGRPHSGGEDHAGSS
jgi:hypothetical protein